MPSQISGALVVRGTLCNNLVLLGCQEREHGLAAFSYGQAWAMGCSTQLSPPLPIPVLGAPSSPLPRAVAAWQSTGEGHGAGASGRHLPFAAEPCSAWPALNHRGFIAGTSWPSSLSPPELLLALLSLSAGILNHQGLPRRNCCCSITLLSASTALVRIRLHIRK